MGARAKTVRRAVTGVAATGALAGGLMTFIDSLVPDVPESDRRHVIIRGRLPDHSDEGAGHEGHDMGGENGQTPVTQSAEGTMSDFGYEVPAGLILSAGGVVEIGWTNEGHVPHDVHVTTESLEQLEAEVAQQTGEASEHAHHDGMLAPIDSGETGVQTIDLSDFTGTEITIYCNQPGHLAAGMVEQIPVGPAQG